MSFTDFHLHHEKRVVFISALPLRSLRSLASSFTHLITSGFAALSLWEGCMEGKTNKADDDRFSFQNKTHTLFLFKISSGSK